MSDADVIPVRDDDYDSVVVQRRRPLEHDITFLQKLGYGIGHFYNDLCASMWFTYLMIFLEKVLKFPSAHAGLLMLIGQVTDGISTPIVGIASDSSVLPNCLEKIGRRISWHVLGTICVTLSFPFIFNTCFACNDTTSEWLRVAWFIPFIMVFQFGWASVQISHLALIPELSSCPNSRTTMNSMRYAFTVIANLLVFTTLYWLLSKITEHKDIGPWDFDHFRLAGLLVVGVGFVVSIVFYISTREPEHGRRLSRLNSFSSEASELMRMHWTSWFGHVQFYQIAMLYMLSRLYINISQVYFPFYITMTQNYEKHYVAVLPMVSYMSSFAVSTFTSLPFVTKYINRKAQYLVGLAIGMSTCVWMLFELPGWKIFAVAVLIGVVQAVLLITSLSITADLINKNTESGAFVYGAMSFLDKLANGIAYQIIELWNPQCDVTRDHEDCGRFYRRIMVFVPGACLVIALIVLLSLLTSNIGKRSRQRVITEDDRMPIVSIDDEEPVFDP